jgi:RNA polymerase sigma-70 factor (ECF subfamily)
MYSIEDVLDIPDNAPGALDQVVTVEERQRLTSCLDELEPQDASAIRAAFLDGATYETLAERLSVPLGTMKSRIRRSLIKLRACLER